LRFLRAARLAYGHPRYVFQPTHNICSTQLEKRGGRWSPRFFMLSIFPYRLLFATLLLAGSALRGVAHDADSYGGLYRSRDAGATWLPADAGLFINASNSIAISPADSNHLLYGTDTRLMRSRNGGRDWQDEAVDLIAGPVFCVAFDRDGRGAYAANGNALFRSDDGVRWRRLEAPLTAMPIAQIVTGQSAVYIAGNDGLYRGSASSQDWSGPEQGLPEEAISALVVADGNPRASIHAVLAGRIWASVNGNTWRQAAGDWRDQRIDTISADSEDAQRLWAGGASRLFRSDDGGKTWQPHGKPLADPNIFIRGIAVAQAGAVIVLTTHRGLMRSADGGATWVKIESALPLHLEPSPLAQDRNDPNIVYTGFSLRPYSEPWRSAQEVAEQMRRDHARKRYTAIALAIGALVLIAAAWVVLRKRAATHGAIGGPQPAERRETK
jgi:photosystem II stability/assembly factor-like uncharacterized protein